MAKSSTLILNNLCFSKFSLITLNTSHFAAFKNSLMSMTVFCDPILYVAILRLNADLTSVMMEVLVVVVVVISVLFGGMQDLFLCSIALR